VLQTQIAKCQENRGFHDEQADVTVYHYESAIDWRLGVQLRSGVSATHSGHRVAHLFFCIFGDSLEDVGRLRAKGSFVVLDLNCPRQVGGALVRPLRVRHGEDVVLGVVFEFSRGRKVCRCKSGVGGVEVSGIDICK
jgi:hypothetical protein